MTQSLGTVRGQQLDRRIAQVAAALRGIGLSSFS
jgi:hypothetical protein